MFYSADVRRRAQGEAVNVFVAPWVLRDVCLQIGAFPIRITAWIGAQCLQAFVSGWVLTNVCFVQGEGNLKLLDLELHRKCFGSFALRGIKRNNREHTHN